MNHRSAINDHYARFGTPDTRHGSAHFAQWNVRDRQHGGRDVNILSILTRVPSKWIIVSTISRRCASLRIASAPISISLVILWHSHSHSHIALALAASVRTPNERRRRSSDGRTRTPFYRARTCRFTRRLEIAHIAHTFRHFRRTSTVRSFEHTQRYAERSRNDWRRVGGSLRRAETEDEGRTVARNALHKISRFLLASRS